ncbi:unnamed protein product [Linum tenue]|uniref:Uncharacterized protein n=1 Tax=Linum tenue TaxID=586396 RepID=A0AAV0IKH0_9ROSI|nr:unnamed protein product [Linum tenue]
MPVLLLGLHYSSFVYFSPVDFSERSVMSIFSFPDLVECRLPGRETRMLNGLFLDFPVSNHLELCLQRALTRSLDMRPAHGGSSHDLFTKDILLGGWISPLIARRLAQSCSGIAGWL